MPEVNWQDFFLKFFNIPDYKASPLCIPFDNIMELLVLDKETNILQEFHKFW